MEIVNVEIFNPKPISFKKDGKTIAEIKKIPAMVNIILFQNDKLFSGMLALGALPPAEMGAALVSMYSEFQEPIQKIIGLCIGQPPEFIEKEFGFYDVMMALTAIISAIVEETKFHTENKKKIEPVKPEA